MSTTQYHHLPITYFANAIDEATNMTTRYKRYCAALEKRHQAQDKKEDKFSAVAAAVIAISTCVAATIFSGVPVIAVVPVAAISLLAVVLAWSK